MTFEYVKYVLPMRRRYQAQGLTVWGKPRRQRPLKYPQLAGLDRRTYRRLWTCLQRQKKTL